MVVKRASPVEKKQQEGWAVKDVSVDAVGGGESLAEKTILEQGTAELKKEIQSFYQLEEEQITIRLEE